MVVEFQRNRLPTLLQFVQVKRPYQPHMNSLDYRASHILALWTDLSLSEPCGYYEQPTVFKLRLLLKMILEMKRRNSPAFVAAKAMLLWQIWRLRATNQQKGLSKGCWPSLSYKIALLNFWDLLNPIITRGDPLHKLAFTLPDFSAFLHQF